VLKDFNVSSFKKSKPPSDNSFDTAQEIKALKKIPLKKDYVKKYDNIEAAFKKTAEEQGVEDYDEQLVAKLVKDSAPIILELKKHYNRPRPYELDKSLAHFKMKSMETPSYPSGHSVQGMLIGNVLKMKYGKSAFMQTAKNISYSRRVARAHYKSDSKMGEKLGNSMFNFIKDKI
jgi:acid phosphatase (class A)